MVKLRYFLILAAGDFYIWVVDRQADRVGTIGSGPPLDPSTEDAGGAEKGRRREGSRRSPLSPSQLLLSFSP